MAATYNKFDAFTLDVLTSKHNFETNTFKVLLSNVAPIAANSVKTDVTEIAAGNGYSAGGNVTTITETTTSGTAKIAGSQVIFTASGGSIGPFRYAVLYNDTSPTKPLVAWWDYGSPVALLNTETITVTFDAAGGIFQMS